MNQIINMFLRLVMRKLMSKGIDAGIKGATGMARGRKKSANQNVSGIDDHGNRIGRDTSERDRIRAERRAKRAARQQQD